MQDNPLHLIASNKDVGKRLDKYLSEQTEFSRQRVQQLLKDGHIICDGKVVAQSSHKVKVGQVYQISIPQVQTVDIVAEAIPLDIIYEDAHVLVVNKAAGMVVHPAAGHYSGTLVNALMHHCKDSLSGIGGEARPGIVHRLDRDTSGLMLVAKHDKAHHHLSAQLKDRSLSRTYHAWVWGAVQPMHGSINAPLARSIRDRKKMAVMEGGREAITDYKTLQHFMQGQIFASHIECKLHTGRTHQIRVHMAHKKAALIGDKDYGYGAQRKAAEYKLQTSDALDTVTTFARQALHAKRIKFIHPESQEMMEFACEIPDDILQLHQALSQIADEQK
jgi:23S rRNA pseudouridine1911/1915/1917 synthase